ncbi:hypothetical protein AB0D04_19965 [Streptomyces sp. NPDC048483]|uniref:hypothetical protein n=1 Tax=Streptomyces sp. NPDC048483 TaxID=3154927 RepID=UPI00343B6CE7
MGEVAVQEAVVGVRDTGEAVAIELGAEDRREGGARGVDRAAACLARFDLADPGEQLPGQPAVRIGGVEARCGLLVGRQDGGGDARLGGSGGEAAATGWV